jgi:hypothetical protein
MSDTPGPTPTEVFRSELAKEDTCPRCLGELDTGWECNDCGYDAMKEATDERYVDPK